MITLAIVSDIHGNLPALEAVLAHASHRAVDHRYHLGDLGGYAPWPNEVVALLRAEGIVGVAGNYDSTVATNHDHCGCHYDDPHQQQLASLSYEWTRRHVTAETVAYLAGLPFRLDLRPLGGHRAGPTVTLVHGSPDRNTVYWTESRSDDFCAKMAEKLRSRAGDVVVFGHTHLPWHRTVDGIDFVNAGSVGRPKDGDPRACFLLLHMEDGGVRPEWPRVEYDVDRARREIRKAGLPLEFGEYLATGGTHLEPA